MCKYRRRAENRGLISSLHWHDTEITDTPIIPPPLFAETQPIEDMELEEATSTIEDMEVEEEAISTSSLPLPSRDREVEQEAANT